MTLHPDVWSVDHLTEVDIEWLRLLVGDWQILADLSMADLVLWVHRGDQWLAGAHARPTTATMVFLEDVVGRLESDTHGLDWVVEAGGRVHLGGRERQPGQIIDEDAVAVRNSERTVAVLTRHTMACVLRTPTALEQEYRAMADDLMTMVAQGEFPTLAPATGARRGAPRVGDGVLHLDATGLVSYASPNAVSALHRLGVVGDPSGHRLLDVVSNLPPTTSSRGTPVDEAVPVVLSGRAAWWTEIDTGSVQVSVRAIPMVHHGRRTGGIVLMRDVTSLRRGEDALLSREASVREVHHRVKNNLQTVSALLRLQARRVVDPAARAALETAVHRVGTIAVVHEILARTTDELVDVDPMVDRVLGALTDLGSGEGPPPQITRRGHFGTMSAEAASAVAMVVSELVQNAITHGSSASEGVALTANRTQRAEGSWLRVEITDRGPGMPLEQSGGSGGLGREIVRSLVADLGGQIEWDTALGGGTRVRFTAGV